MMIQGSNCYKKCTDMILQCDVGVSLHCTRHTNHTCAHTYAHQYPTLFPVLFLCHSINFVIFRQYGTKEKGVIYPGEMEVSVDLHPDAMGCSNLTVENTDCTATITSNDNYTVSLTVTNDLDSVMTMMAFDCEFILVTIYM